MDRTELGCLKAIVLFNPDIKHLQDSNQVEGLREKVYASLEAYAKQKYPDQPGRFAKGHRVNIFLDTKNRKKIKIA